MRFLIPLLLLFPLALSAQSFDFEGESQPKVSVYDSWEASPFRTGRLTGNVAVIADPFRDKADGPNHVLALQRSRYGSNTFGARIDLPKPIALNPRGTIVSFAIYTPVSSKLMVIGLGKRTDRPGQSPETEQCWALSEKPVKANQWLCVSEHLKANEGVELHSVVLVPHCESPHDLTSDFAAYFDNVMFREKDTTNINVSMMFDGPSAEEIQRVVRETPLPETDKAYITAAGRNGDVLTLDGRSLSHEPIEKGKPIKFRVVPENGFTLGSIKMQYGYEMTGRAARIHPLRRRERVWDSSWLERQADGTFLFGISGDEAHGDIRIDANFIEETKDKKQ